MRPGQVRTHPIQLRVKVIICKEEVDVADDLMYPQALEINCMTHPIEQGRG